MTIEKTSVSNADRVKPAPVSEKKLKDIDFSLGELKRHQQAEHKSYSLHFACSLVVVSDILILLATSGIIHWSYLGWVEGRDELYFLAMVAPTAVVIVTFYQAGLYDFSSICKPILGQIYKTLGILAITFLAFLALAFALKISEEFSRIWVFSWFLSSGCLIFLERKLFHLLFWRWARDGRLTRKIVLVGCSEQAKKYIEHMEESKEPWIDIVGFFDDRKERIQNEFMGYPVLGNVDDLLKYARIKRVDDIILTLPWTAEHRIIEVVRKLEELPIDIRLGSDLAGFLRLNPSYSSIGGVPMVDVVNKPLSGWKYVLKGMEDKILGTVLLIVFLPFMLLIALAIKLESRGPVFFRQRRNGFNYKQFSVFKFRTMRHDCTSEKEFVQARQDDPRVTPLGKFLRRTSLDELPQLFNVLSGTMSLVGPRPHPLALDNEFSRVIGGYFARHRVKPGMTGWAQVNGFRGETETREKMRGRFEHDIYYIENWSLLFDALILIKTVPAAILQKNAH